MKKLLSVRTIILAGSLLLQFTTLCFQSRGAAADVDLAFDPGSGVNGRVTAVVVQPATGFWMIAQAGLPWNDLWLVATFGLYVVAALCWLPVVAIQIRMRGMAVEAEHGCEPLPDAYRRLFHWWTGLGFGAFFPFLLIFWLMVAKRLPWAG